MLTTVLFTFFLGLAHATSVVNPFPKGDVQAVAVPFTAFYNATGDGVPRQPNAALVDEQCKYAVDQGYPWALVGGTTSEWPSLTTAERLALMDAWSAASRKHGLKLLMHVGHSQVGEARKLAAHAEALKVDAVLIAPPMLPFRAPTLDLLVETLGHVLSAAPSRPAVYYHYPQLYGDTFAAKDMLLAGLPTLVGIKCAGEISHTELMEAATAPGDFAVITTADKTVDAVAFARRMLEHSFCTAAMAWNLTS